MSPRRIDVQEIRYRDHAGVLQVLDPCRYTVLDGELAMVEPAIGRDWPRVCRHRRAIEIDFVAGYGEPADVPGPIRTAIKMMVGDLFANREQGLVTDGPATAVENPFVRRLLFNYRPKRV